MDACYHDLCFAIDQKTAYILLKLDGLQRLLNCEGLRAAASISAILHRSRCDSRGPCVHVVLIADLVINAILQRPALISDNDAGLLGRHIAHITAARKDHLRDPQISRVRELHDKVHRLRCSEAVRHPARICHIIGRLHCQNTAARSIDPRPIILIVQLTLTPLIAETGDIVGCNSGSELNACSLRDIAVSQFVPALIVGNAHVARIVDRNDRQPVVQHDVKICKQYVSISIIDFTGVSTAVSGRDFRCAAVSDLRQFIAVWIKPCVADLPALAAARPY